MDKEEFENIDLSETVPEMTREWADKFFNGKIPIVYDTARNMNLYLHSETNTMKAEPINTGKPMDFTGMHEESLIKPDEESFQKHPFVTAYI